MVGWGYHFRYQYHAFHTSGLTDVAIATDIEKAKHVVTAIVLVLANAIAGGAANASARARASATVNINGSVNAILNVSFNVCVSAMIVAAAATVLISPSICVLQNYM